MPAALNAAALEAAYKAFWEGPPGVVRRVQNIDSYPGEYRGDPEAYTPIRTTMLDERRAIEDAIRAYLDASA